MKIHPLFLLGCLIAVIILLQKGCICNGGGKAINDTISHTIDTIWIESKADTHYVPEPYAIYYPKEIVTHDTLEISEVIPAKVDTARILAQYFAKRYYIDTQLLDFGSIILRDTVTQNRIIGRGVVSKFNIPVVKETTVITGKRTVGYFGISAMGNQAAPLFSVGATLGLKFKNDKYYGIGAHLTKSGELYYSAEFKMPIRFK